MVTLLFKLLTDCVPLTGFWRCGFSFGMCVRRNRVTFNRRHDQFAVSHVDMDRAAKLKRSGKDAVREAVFHHIGDYAAQWASTELRVVTLFAQ